MNQSRLNAGQLLDALGKLAFSANNAIKSLDALILTTTTIEAFNLEPEEPSYENANNPRANRTRNGKATDPRNNDYRNQRKGSRK